MISYREMRQSDLDQAAAMDAEIFSQPWSKAGFLSSLLSADTLYLAAVESDCPSEKLVGYCGYLRSFEIADITNVAVREEYRRRGIARKMLSLLMEEGRRAGIERFTLEVRKGNDAAIRLYEQLGFYLEGYRPGYYDLPKEDAAIMWTPETET